MCAPDGRRRSNVFWSPKLTIAVLSGRERLDGRLVKADHATEGALDEVKLILQDQVRRREAPDGHVRANGSVLQGTLRQRRRPLRGTPCTVVPEIFVVSVHVAEEAGSALLEREPGELVNCGDDNG